MLEAVLVILILVAVTAPMVYRLRGKLSTGGFAAAVSSWAVLCVLFAGVAVGYPRPGVAYRTAASRPLEAGGDGYVTSSACRACHPGEYGSWFDSYHRTMTQPATPASIVAPWDNEMVIARGETYRFERRGDEFWAEMPASKTAYATDSDRVWRQIVQVTGRHHWQFYWYATGMKRELGLLLCSYRVADEPRWMPLDGCCLSPPDGGQESGTGRWHHSCNKCHATHGQPRIDEPGGIDTHVAELGIACEACHGPGESHVTVNRDPLRRYALHGGGGDDDSIVNPSRLDKVRSSHVCGQCHSVNRMFDDEHRRQWMEEGFAYRPGDDLSETRSIDRNGTLDKFWPDGMIRVSGREYNGLIESPCYQHGEMTCLSCHVMHQREDDPRPRSEWANDQLGVGMDGDLACTQCHAGYDTPEKVAAHTHHRADSTGSACYNCHMPHTTFGLLKAIRTHEVFSPNVALDHAAGRPNACNQCHLDRTLAWTADWMSKWYGQPVPALPDEHRRIAATVLWAMRGDAGQRALAAWTMGWDAAREASGSSWLVPYLSIMMNDPYHAVRYIAHRSAGRLPAFEGIDYDFMAPHEVRFKEAYRYFQSWHARGGGGDAHDNGVVLIDGSHQLIMQEVNRLIDAQDARRVTLNE